MRTADRAVKKRMSAVKRRRVIVSAAECVFAEVGYQGASMEAVASAAGISKPVLYDHFKSKVALFAGVIECIREDLLSTGAEALVRNDTPETRMRASLNAFFEYVEARPTAVKVMFIVPRGEPELANLFNSVQAHATEELASRLQAVTGPIEQWRATMIVEFIKQGLHSLAEWWVMNPDVSRDAMVETVMRVTWTGLSPPKGDDAA